MDLLFVSCAIESSRLSYPLASLYLKAVVDASPDLAAETALIECTLSDMPAEIAKRCERYHEPVIACSIYVWNRAWFTQFIHTVKEYLPHAVLLIGGPEVTALPESFSALPVDHIVTGEGEIPILQILTGHDQQTGTAYYQDINAIPSPILTHTAHLDAYKGIIWEMTRGCPYACAFCYESKGIKRIRSYSMERLQQELEMIIEADITDVFILDPTFNMISARAKEILRMLITRAGTSIRFHFEIRAELLDEEMADLFAELDCALQIGMQSSDPRVLRAVGRTFDPDLFRARIDLLVRRNIVFGLDLIYGLPTDSLEGFHASLEYAASLRPSNLDIFRLAILPGTTLHDQIETLALHADTEPPYLIRSTPDFPEEDLAKADTLKDLCDLFYTAGEASMWFHRITESCGMDAASFLIEFGQWMEERDADTPDSDIYSMQLEFVQTILTRTGREEYVAPAVSYMTLHQGLNILMRTGELQLLELQYHPDDLALLDTMPIAAFITRMRPAAQTLSMYLFDGMIYFEEIEPLDTEGDQHELDYQQN